MRTLFAPLRDSALLCMLLALVAPLAADAQGPGLPNLNYTSGELFQPLSVIRSTAGTSARGQGAVAMHDGYLLVIYAPDSGRAGGGFSFYDISNPRSPHGARTIQAKNNLWCAGTRFSSIRNCPAAECRAPST